MQKKEATDLLKKYLAGNCSEEECGLLETWYLKYEGKSLPERSQEEKDAQLEEIWTVLSKKLDAAVQETSVESQVTAQESILEHKTPLLWSRIAIAAMVLIALSIGFYFYHIPDKTLHVPQEQISESGINAVHQKAMLTLADGKTITLDEVKNGEIAEQGGITITKTKDGQLVYEVAANEGAVKENAFNKIETPKGGQYQINLPDGTKVWLNAASSLSYPASFTGDKRAVKLIGEAYFEVAKQNGMPFIVQSKGQEVVVLGTHFNVNAYPDEEQIKTTLLEGTVKVKLVHSAASALLKPGQQSIIDENQLDVNAVDVSEVIAWKEGYFLFQDEDIRSMMRKIEKWYDVEVIYAANISPKKIGGRISRNKSLDYVLKTLSKTDKFNFKVEGRRVTVMP
ncbi:FecR family protein [Pedobacter sp. N36a]|uniref:FecR family protein n=1 Tax=Pedobacter sp. N36a TaxID=2767996 RepID=UPI00165699FA|nr:FecR family protein [Pedobacter sp. N36a]MBC8987974.1 FecR family protein [Pedobacter sp. N36a]